MQEHIGVASSHLKMIVTGDIKDSFNEIQKALNTARENPDECYHSLSRVVAFALAGMEMTRQDGRHRGRVFITNGYAFRVSGEPHTSASRWAESQGLQSCTTSMRGMITDKGLYFYNEPDGRIGQVAIDFFIDHLLPKVMFIASLRNPEMELYAGAPSRTQRIGRLSDYYVWTNLTRPAHDFLDSAYFRNPPSDLINARTGAQVWPS